MQELFGIPVGTLALVLAALVLGALAVLGVFALRNRVFVRLGVRNVRRRPARSALIVTGLMLGTAIVAAALATPEGKALVMTLWRDAETAEAGLASGLYDEQVEQYVAFFRSPPGRELYEVVHAETPAGAAA